MTTELQMLVWAVALTLVQMFLAVVLNIRQHSLPVLAGNRENLPESTGAAGRAIRAHRNMLESIALFAALVLVAHAAGVSNAMTVLGAQLFFWGRLAFALVYWIGVPWLRTAVWGVALAGLVLILLQLV